MKHNTLKKELKKEWSTAKFAEFFYDACAAANVCNQNIRPRMIRVSNLGISMQQDLLLKYQWLRPR